MECIFQGMSDVAPYLDNVIITGKYDEEHLTNLLLVLEKISQAGLPIHEGENGCSVTCSKWSRDSTMYRKGGSNSECSSSFQCHQIKGVPWPN